MSFFDFFQNNNKPSSPYESLTLNQKLAAMSLMMFIGDFGTNISFKLKNISHIMSVEGQKMGISVYEIRKAHSMFPEMRDSVNALKGVNKNALENLFWACYSITIFGGAKKAVPVLMNIYSEFGFSEEERLRLMGRREKVINQYFLRTW